MHMRRKEQRRCISSLVSRTDALAWGDPGWRGAAEKAHFISNCPSLQNRAEMLLHNQMKGRKNGQKGENNNNSICPPPQKDQAIRVNVLPFCFPHLAVPKGDAGIKYAG